MKLRFYTLILLLFTACEEQEPDNYNLERDSLYFTNDPIEVNFATRTKSINGKNVFLGDSLKYDTVSARLAVIGYPVDRDREIFFKTVPIPGQDTAHLAEVIVLSPCYVSPNLLKDTIKIAVAHPAKRQIDYVIGLTIDEEKGEFDRGANEGLILKITVRDKYTKPNPDWDNFFQKYLGEWSPEKYAFLLMHFQSKELPSKGAGMMWQRKLLPEVKKALKDFNDAHPGEEKDFTFPE